MRGREKDVNAVDRHGSDANEHEDETNEHRNYTDEHGEDNGKAVETEGERHQRERQPSARLPKCWWLEGSLKLTRSC